MLKKLSMILIAAVLFIGILPIQGLQAKAASTIKEGHQTTTDGVFSYQKIKEGNKETAIKITGFNDSQKEVTVPDQLENLPVTEIGYSVFENTGIEKITLPKDLVTIENTVFAETSSLKNIELPKDLVTIGNAAFEGSGIEEIKIPEGVEVIDGFAFATTKSLKKIELPKNLTKIGGFTFWGSGIEEIKIPEGVEVIDGFAFAYTKSLKKIELPNNLKSIGSWAFYESGIEEIKIPEGVEVIDYSSFASTESLKKIELPKDLKSIEVGAFGGSGIEEIKIPGGVTSIEKETFEYTKSLKKIELPKNLKSIGVGAFYGSGIEEIKIPGGVTSIEVETFAYTKSLKNIELPKNLTSIEGDAFYGSGIEAIIIPEGVTTIKGRVFQNSDLKEILIPVTVNDIHATAFDSLLNVIIFGAKGSKAEEVAKSKVSDDFKFIEMGSSLATSVTVTYDGNGQESGTAPSVTSHDKVELLTVEGANSLYKEKEYVGNWNEERDGTGRIYSIGSRFGIYKNLLLYAQWQPKKIVIFNLDNSQLAKVYVEPNQKVKAPTAPTKPNHTLDGWYKENDFKTQWEFETDLVTKDLTMYAKWIENPQVSFEANNNTPVKKVYVEPNQKVKAPTSPTKANHIFDGWYKDADFKSKWDFATDIVTENLTLHAKWVVGSSGGSNSGGSNSEGSITNPEPKQNPVILEVLTEVSDIATKLEGITSPNAAISLQSEGVEIATGTSNSEGYFSIKLPALKANMNLTIVVIDKAGQTKIIALQVLDRTPPKIELPKWDGISTEIIGIADAGTTIELHINDKLVATTIADENGNYSLTIGKQQVGAKLEIWAIDKAGNVTKQQMQVTGISMALKINPFSDRDTKISGTTEARAKVEIYINNKLLKKLTANKRGNYSYKVTKKKAGTVIKVTAKDTAGNTITKTMKVLDKTAPKVKINPFSDKDTKISGTTEASAKVEIYLNNKLLKKLTATKRGNYSYKVPKKKAGADIKVIAKDAAGNSTTKTMKILDKTAPSKPTVDKVTMKTTEVTGKAEAYSTVYVYKSKKLVGKASATKKGKYSIKIKKQKVGTVLTIQAVDQAKNKSMKASVKVKK